MNLCCITSSIKFINMMVGKEMVMMDLMAMVILMVMKVMVKVIADNFVCMKEDSNGSHAAERDIRIWR